MTTKYIFVTGGVVSSLGKGVAAASIGALLEARGFKVTVMKFDPYVNVDPGTMSPYQHGEVFVTDDGAETDLDLGHYERFTHSSTSQAPQLHDRADLRGGHHQGAPRRLPGQDGPGHSPRHRRDQGGDAPGRRRPRRRHRRDRRHRRRHRVAAVSGGDPAVPPRARPQQRGQRPPDPRPLHRRRRRAQDEADAALGAGAARHRHPARHAPLPRRPADARGAAAQDRALLQRRARTGDRGARRLDDLRSARCCSRARGSTRRCSTSSTCPTTSATSAGGKRWSSKIKNPKNAVRIGIVGKYVELPDAYKSLNEALLHGGIANDCKVDLVFISAEEIESGTWPREVFDVDGLLVPIGFGPRGTEGKIRAIRYAREHKVPFFGICLGMQCMAIEFARNVCGIEKATSTEFDPDAAASGDLQAARPARRRGDGRHDAARRLPVRPHGGHSGAPHLRRSRRSPSAIATATRSIRSTWRSSRSTASWSPGSPPTASSSRWSSSPTTPGSSAASSTPSTSRSRPSPIRSSSPTSARRSRRRRRRQGAARPEHALVEESTS